MTNTARYLTWSLLLPAVALAAVVGSARATDPRVASAAPDATFAPQPGDHICLIGNTLGERMQHFGWLETLMHSRFPQHQLVFRNLAYSGDEIAGFTDKPDATRRLRSMDFGTSDQWLAGSATVPQPQKILNKDAVRDNRFELTNTRADVIFAFFGYNESFADTAGLAKFKQDLTAFIQHARSQKYNGKSPPRLVLFSPIAHEDLQDPNLPNGSENNRRIAMYTRAMADTAAAHQVTFVDLFNASKTLYAQSAEPLTINGVHLNEAGDKAVALAIDRALFAAPAPRRDPAALEALRQLVNDKNFYWFHRYRATDGYSTYGDRAFLKFTNNQTNYEVVQRELEALDLMTANRERRVWQAAAAPDSIDRLPPVVDNNLPELLPVISNKPGPLAGGAHEFLSGKDAIGKMTIADGMKVELFASEETFPELINPVQMAFDTRGRLWVAAWPTYPHWRPTEEMNDKLLILEDSDGDGRADVCKTFASGLHNPTGFEFWGGGVFVAQGPDVLFLKDNDGDDRADVSERVLHGIDTADTHHTINSFTLDPGGALYFQEGTFHHSQVESPWGPPERCANAGVFRFEPRTSKFEVFVSYGFANPHGHVFDRWGQNFVTDGTGNVNYFAAAFSGRVEFPAKHPHMEPFFKQRVRPCPATEFLSTRHFPPALQGAYLDANVIGFQGILMYRVQEHESGFTAAEIEPMISSTDPSFRPTDLEVAPDGSLYFIDWQNPIIGHMQHNLRDPNRDRQHGRVYRITYPARPLLKPAKIAGATIDELLDLLKEPEDRVRYRARIELSARQTADVLASLDRWIAQLSDRDPEHEHHVLEALWVRQQHNAVDRSLLERVLKSPDPRARAAATRVLCYWRDRVDNSLERLKELAADPHPRVRLEAVRAASFFRVPEAMEVPLVAADYPLDYYLNYCRNETIKTLEPYWNQALSDGRRLELTSDAGNRYFLRSTPTEQLLRLDRTRAVNLEILFRPGLHDDLRRAALAALARQDKKPEWRVLIDAITLIDDKKEQRDDSVFFDLVRLLAGRDAAELAAARGDFERLATSAKQPITRQIGFVALVNLDGSIDGAWRLAGRSIAALTDFVQAVPFISDPSLRASLYPELEKLLVGLPPTLAGAAEPSQGTAGRYVRIELTGNRRTLTLAEVEVFSDGRNVAPLGKASQKNTAHGGTAARAIDGNKAGLFGMAGQTHTEETKDPWWELDLGQELPIDSIVIHNRTDSDLGRRLNGFTLRILDAGRAEVVVRDKLPAPPRNAELKFEGSGPAGIVRRAAMNAMTSIRGQEAKTFETLARYVQDDRERIAAIRALQRIPRSHWPKEHAAPLLELIVAYLGQLPIADRTAPAALDAMEFGHALVTLLPGDEARRVRAQLGELGVRVIRIGTLLERMAFDKEVIAVAAGRPVEFIFDNTDLMPHNLVITQPGALEEIGQLAESTATDPRAAERHYVPESSKVLLASRLLLPRESQKLSFQAPKQPGVYPYVCTFPGHWRRMFGALYVVENLDEYLADPERYLASHALPIHDELLKEHRPRTEWKFEDLVAAVEGLQRAPGGRSFNNGKHLFQIASCVACHRLDAAGNEFGADLTKLDAKLGPADILRDILEPSSKINEKYQTYVFATEAGKLITGLILDESPDAVKVIENPLASAQPTLLKTSDIAERKKSTSSIMPKGLLDKLSRDEILDLVAFVVARGDRKHPVFHGAHDHAAGHAPNGH